MSKIITDEYILEILKQHNYLSGMEYEWLADRLEALTLEKEILDKRSFLLGLENARLRAAIGEHIAWWHEPGKHPEPSTEAYGKLREALREKE